MALLKRAGSLSVGPFIRRRTLLSAGILAAGLALIHRSPDSLSQFPPKSISLIRSVPAISNSLLGNQKHLISNSISSLGGAVGKRYCSSRSGLSSTPASSTSSLNSGFGSLLQHRLHSTLSSLFSSISSGTSESGFDMTTLVPPQAPPKWTHTAEEIIALTKKEIEKHKAVEDKVAALAPEECNFKSVRVFSSSLHRSGILNLLVMGACRWSSHPLYL